MRLPLIQDQHRVLFDFERAKRAAPAVACSHGWVCGLATPGANSSKNCRRWILFASRIELAHCELEGCHASALPLASCRQAKLSFFSETILAKPQ
jgi:hypothetical protein